LIGIWIPSRFNSECGHIVVGSHPDRPFALLLHFLQVKTRQFLFQGDVLPHDALQIGSAPCGIAMGLQPVMVKRGLGLVVRQISSEKNHNRSIKVKSKKKEGQPPWLPLRRNTEKLRICVNFSKVILCKKRARFAKNYFSLISIY
jgi:hypothetical protein